MARYVTLEDALEVHAVVIKMSGGTLGVRDMNSLTGCLERPKAAFGGNDMYASLFEKAAVYIDSVSRNHPLLDGNKRTAFLCGVRFLSLNGITITIDNNEIVRGVLWVVTEHPTIQEIAAWLERHSSQNNQ